MTAAPGWLPWRDHRDEREHHLAPEHQPEGAPEGAEPAGPAMLAAAAGNATVSQLLRGGPPPVLTTGAGNAAFTRALRDAQAPRDAQALPDAQAPRDARVQRSELAVQGAGPLDERIAAAIDAERGGGAPLPEPVRAGMEHHLGADLSAVRVHTGPTADRLNRSVSAEAFTSGTDVFITGGRYDPGSTSGRELLAHELTHVVQQATGSAGDAAQVSHPDDPAEVEAREVGRQIGQQPAADPATPSAAHSDAVLRHTAGGHTDEHSEPDEAAEHPGVSVARHAAGGHSDGHSEPDEPDEAAELPVLPVARFTGGVAPVHRCGSIPPSECPCHAEESGDAAHPPVQRAPAKTGEPAEQEELDAGTAWKYKFDGCSVPAQVAAVMGVQWGSFDKDNPAGGKDTQFAIGKPTTQGGIACDRHDECYQSCGTDKFACDERMHHDMKEICAKSSEVPHVKALCNQWAEVYYTALSKFGQSAFDMRKEQVCGFDAESMPPAFRYPPRELLKQRSGAGAGSYVSYLDYTVMSTFLPLSAYQLIGSEEAYQRYVRGEPAAEEAEVPEEQSQGRSLLKMR